MDCLEAKVTWGLLDHLVLLELLVTKEDRVSKALMVSEVPLDLLVKLA